MAAESPLPRYGTCPKNGKEALGGIEVIHFLFGLLALVILVPWLIGLGVILFAMSRKLGPEERDVD